MRYFAGLTAYLLVTTNNEYMDDKIITKITEHLKELENSDVLRGEPADIAVNAPLALMQCHTEGKIQALKWVLKTIKETTKAQETYADF